LVKTNTYLENFNTHYSSDTKNTKESPIRAPLVVWVDSSKSVTLSSTDYSVGWTTGATFDACATNLWPFSESVVGAVSSKSL
jgi:hypothetical protein